ncbi:MAG: amino acid permease [Candidatus Binatia bacterium]|nr:amino acid permease [Candidatus Binatia bacterium]
MRPLHLNQRRREVQNSKVEFVRVLGLWDATAIVAGSMIGSGIFLVSADIARVVDAPAWLLAVWIATMLLTLAAAVNYGELAALFPKAGGQYVFLREAYGSLAGFLYGWTLFTVIQTGTIAAVAVAFAKFSAVFTPDLLQATATGFFAIDGQRFLAIVVIVILTVVNCVGLQAGRWVQNVFTAAKVGSLLAVVLVGCAAGPLYGHGAVNWAYFWGREPLDFLTILPLLGAAMVGALFSADAWHNVTFTAAEVRDPERNIPASLLLGSASVTLLYVLANVAYLSVLPLWGSPAGATAIERGIQYAANDRVATAAMEVLLGQTGVLAMAAAVLVSTFGCANGLILAGARVYQAMAEDGLFFRAAALLNTKRVPAVALMLQSVWATVLILSGTYSDLLDYVIFAALLFYALTAGSVIVLRVKHPNLPRPYRAFGYPWLTCLYITVTLAILIDLLVVKPRYTWPGLLIVAAGIPIYFIARRSNSENAGSLT